MDLFGKNFLQIRNSHIIPKASFGVLQSKYEYWSLKEIFTNKILSLNKLGGKSYEIEISTDDYYKAIHCDIELFMNKTLVQYSDFKVQGNVSPSWSFITLYYFLFFNATCLFRFIDKGFVFFSRENSKNLENYSIALYSNLISVDVGNYYFSVKEINSYGNIIVTLSFKGDSVHKSTWIQLESTLREFIIRSDQNEKVVLNLLLSHFIGFKTEYPSNLRNKLNYNADSSMLDLGNKLPYSQIKDINDNYLEALIKLNISSKNNSVQIESVSFLVSYLFELNKKLYKEYLERSKFGKDFDRERSNYLKAKLKT
jgi:hypothetical protein